jgi:hypothetical protein
MAERARKTGASEQEASILYHLDEAGRLFYELPGLTRTDLETCAGHVSALVRVLASRVADISLAGTRPVPRVFVALLRRIYGCAT